MTCHSFLLRLSSCCCFLRSFIIQNIWPFLVRLQFSLSFFHVYSHTFKLNFSAQHILSFIFTTLCFRLFSLSGISLEFYYGQAFLQNFTGNIKTQTNFFAFPEFFGLSSFALEGIGTIFVLRDTAPSPEQFPKMVKAVMVFATLFMAAFGAVCAGALEQNTPDMIFYAFVPQDFYIYTLGVIYGIVLFVCLPIFIFPISSSIESIGPVRRFVQPNVKTNKY
jgi:Transmembrane amino acid transporter protein